MSTMPFFVREPPPAPEFYHKWFSFLEQFYSTNLKKWKSNVYIKKKSYHSRDIRNYTIGFLPHILLADVCVTRVTGFLGGRVAKDTDPNNVLIYDIYEFNFFLKTLQNWNKLLIIEL